jgi:hypothetical protein
MLSEEGAERPKAVTIIGRVWLVVAVLYLCRALVNLAVWMVLQPDAPSLFGELVAQSPRNWLLRPRFEHLTALMTAQALWWAAVGFSAFLFLRLRPWARVAIQGACWALLLYAALFAVFWAQLWLTMPPPGAAPAPGAYQHRTLALIGGLAVCAAIATGLVTMIVSLRSAAVRFAFRRQADTRPAGGKDQT